MKILVTGGLGYIGSHTVVELVNKGHSVVIVDNLINSKLEVLGKLELILDQKIPFYQIDMIHEQEMEDIFLNYTFDGIVHFAGLKAVGESVEKPIEYYENNLMSTIVLSKMAIKYKVDKFVFSSSATVYGDQPSPLHEELELKITTNPYGETKAICERILSDIVLANQKFRVSLLRYFNPVGAHESGMLGEDPNGIPNNLMPYVSKVAKGDLKELNIFGNDYNTVDGTGERDYIHVVDLAKGHVAAIEQLTEGVNIYNLGTGKGTSVLEMVNTFSRVNKINVPYKVVSRRPGDIAICYADVSKAERELNWKATLGIEDMCRDMWNFEMNINK